MPGDAGDLRRVEGRQVVAARREPRDERRHPRERALRAPAHALRRRVGEQEEQAVVQPDQELGVARGGAQKPRHSCHGAGGALLPDARIAEERERGVAGGHGAGMVADSPSCG